jgi:hypothetical protein
MDIDKLNNIYEDVLGKGPALEEEAEAKSLSAGSQDGAYGQEDYGDDAEDGVDPRDASTQIEEEVEDAVGIDEDQLEDKELDDEEYEDVPERLVEAGRAANLSDRDIIELAETHPEALEALARAQEAQHVAPRKEEHVQDKPVEKKPAGTFEPLKLEFSEDDRDEMGERSLEIINSLVDKVNTLGAQVAEQGEATRSVQEREVQEKIRVIDETFDGMAKDIPALGSTGSLDEDQKANRIFAFNAARAAMQAYGNLTTEQALAIGANALRGQQTESQVKAKIISDLNKNKKRFVSRARSRNRPAPKKSVDERAVEAISKVLDDPKYH